MATKKTQFTGDWRGFFNYHLSEAEKVTIRDLLGSKKAPSIGDCLLELSKNNYKTTFTRNPSNDTFVCSVTGKEGSLNRGYTYALTHVDLRVAIIGLWFVVGEVHEWGEWPVGESDIPNW